MKIVRFSQNGHAPRLGCFLGQDRVADLEASAVAFLASRGVVRAPVIAAALFPHDSTRGFLEGGSASQDMLTSMLDAARGGKFQPVAHALSSVRLHAPIADRTEIPDPHVLDLKTWVNDQLMQNGSTRNFIFDIGYIIQYLTNIMTLSPGDLIATGTPAGVGFSRKPQVTLQPGDRMKLEITGLGSLENSVKDA